jgi:hypothetical protein
MIGDLMHVGAVPNGGHAAAAGGGVVTVPSKPNYTITVG